MKKHWCLLAIALAGFGMGPIGCMQAEHGEHGEKAELEEQGEHGEKSGKAEEKESDEVKVAFDKLSAAVQETFNREASGVAIKEVDQEKLDGKDVYEADAAINGTNHEIVVSPDGKLVSNKVDNENAEAKGKEAGEKDAKDEKGEHKD